jgi:peptidoglycan/xylan/chitin deacetylase (PgdA/CDA1 family)
VSLAGVQPSIAQPPLQRGGSQGVKPIDPLDMIGRPEPTRMGVPTAPKGPEPKPESTPRPKALTPTPAPRPAPTPAPMAAPAPTDVEPQPVETPASEPEQVMLRYVPGTGTFETLLPTTRTLTPRSGYRGPSAPPYVAATPKPRPQTVATAVPTPRSAEAFTGAALPRLPQERLPQFLASAGATGYYSPEMRSLQPGVILGGPGLVAFDPLALQMSLPPAVTALLSGQMSGDLASGTPLFNPDTLAAGLSRSLLPSLPGELHAQHGSAAMTDTLRSLLPPDIPTGLFVSADRIAGYSLLPETVPTDPYPGYIGKVRASTPSHTRPETGPVGSEVAPVITKALPNLSPQQTAMAGPIIARPSLSGDGGEMAQIAMRRAQRYRAVQDQVGFESFSGGVLPQKVVSITFDDGPDSTFTPRVLEALKREDVKATFFVLGSKADDNPALLRRISAEGHDIGNHSYNHYDLSYLDPIGVRSEITRTGQAISRAVQERTRWFRAPGCRYTVETLLQLRDLGMVRVDATNNPGDAQINDPQLLIRRVLEHLKPGDVILCHDRMPSTAAALPELIRAVKGRGYRFVPLGEMALQAQATPGFKPAYLLSKQGVVIYQSRQQRPNGQPATITHEGPRSSAGPLTPGVLPRMTSNRKGEPLLSRTSSPAGRRVIR